MDPKTCPSCSDKLIDGAHCNACDRDLHYHCAGITEGGYRKLGERRQTWRCQKCKTTGQQIQQIPHVVVSPSTPTSPKEFPTDQPSTSVLLAEIRTLAARLTPLETLIQDVRALREDFSDLRASVKATNDSINEFDARIRRVEDRLSQVENAKKDQLMSVQSRLDTLEEENRNKEQWARMNNIEIKGVKQSKNENLFAIVASIGSKVNYPIEKTSINFVTRVPSRDSEHKPIIVGFNSRYVKDDFIAAARSSMKDSPLSAASLNLGTGGNIYVNDHLTIHNKVLLSKAKKLKKELSFQYLWVKHCKIFMRRCDNSPIIVVSSEKDLCNLEASAL